MDDFSKIDYYKIVRTFISIVDLATYEVSFKSLSVGTSLLSRYIGANGFVRQQEAHEHGMLKNTFLKYDNFIPKNQTATYYANTRFQKAVQELLNSGTLVFLAQIQMDIQSLKHFLGKCGLMNLKFKQKNENEPNFTLRNHHHHRPIYYCC